MAKAAMKTWRSSIVCKAALGMLIVAALLTITRLFVESRFNVYLVENTEPNYQQMLRQFAHKLDNTTSGIQTLFDHVVNDENLCGFVPGIISYNQQRRVMDIATSLNLAAGYSHSVRALFVYSSAESISGLPTFQRSEYYRIGASLRSALLSHAPAGGDYAIASMAAMPFAVPDDIKNDVVVYRALQLRDADERVLLLGVLHGNWLEKLFDGAAVRISAPDGRVLLDKIPNNAASVMRTPCADGWQLEWDAQAAAENVHHTRGFKGLFFAFLGFAFILVLVLGRYSRRVTNISTLFFHMTLVIILPVLLYIGTFFPLMHSTLSQAVHASYQAVYDNVFSNVDFAISKTHQTLLRIMFDPNVYTSYKAEDHASCEMAVCTHLSAANTGMFVRVFAPDGSFVFQTHPFGIATPEKLSVNPKMINTLLRGQPEFETALGSQRCFVYTIKLYDIQTMESAGYIQAGLSEREMTSNFFGGADPALDLFLVDASGTILYCADAHRIGEAIHIGESDFVRTLTRSALRLIAIPDVEKIRSDLYAVIVSCILYVLTALLIVLLAVYIILLHRFSAETIQRIRIESERSTLEIQTLQSQISPHFLCNTLETIRCLIDDCHQDAASYMLAQLSSMFKFSISRFDNVVSAQEELDYTRAYIRLMNIRFDNRIHDEWLIDSELLSCSVLKMILQPIVENSILYALESAESLALTISLGIKDDCLCFLVRDNGIGIPADTLDRIRSEINAGVIRDHIGLINVARRIRLFYGNKYGLQIDSAVGKGTSVYVLLPLELPLADR
jgi:signal transduction histidine kinase